MDAQLYAVKRIRIKSVRAGERLVLKLDGFGVWGLECRESVVCSFRVRVLGVGRVCCAGLVFGV